VIELQSEKAGVERAYLSAGNLIRNAAGVY
jgi:hypothetical protein